LQVRFLLAPLRDVVKGLRRRCAMPKARVRIPPSRSLWAGVDPPNANVAL
jgi:hypothetical protein